MSTKALRALVEGLRSSTTKHGASREEWPALDAAEVELEAIEKAAKDLTSSASFCGGQETIETMVSIAKDAP